MVRSLHCSSSAEEGTQRSTSVVRGKPGEKENVLEKKRVQERGPGFRDFWFEIGGRAAEKKLGIVT